MTILLSDPRVRAVPVADSGEPLVRLAVDLSPAGALVRAGLAERLHAADEALPAGIRLRVVEGHPTGDGSAGDHHGVHPRRSWRRTPASTGAELAPAHQPVRRAGRRRAARRRRGRRPDAGRRLRDPLDLGTPIDATPEESDGALLVRGGRASRGARAHRDLLRQVLEGRASSTTPPSGGTGATATGTGRSSRVRRTRVRAGQRSRWRHDRARRRHATPSAPPARSLEVDLSAVAANTALSRRPATGRLMAVVKADGFGHGAVGARTALAHGATCVGVTCLAEAWPLRDAGIEAPILSWLNPVDADVATAVERRIDLAVPGLRTPRRDGRRAGTRSGCTCTSTPGWRATARRPRSGRVLCRAARLAETRGEVEVVGVMGHLGCADDPADACNARARTRFAWALEVAARCGLRRAERHLAATAATLTDPRSHHTMSRVGAGLVGIDPSRTTTLRPPLTLTAPLVSVRRVRAGTPVGYGHTHVTAEPTYLGLVPLGYADGLPRSASPHAAVQYRGRRAPVVGRISMDQVVVDLGESGGEVGDRVTVFGPGDDGEPTVADWARWSDTIEHEIVTGLGTRVPRHIRSAPRLRSVR